MGINKMPPGAVDCLDHPTFPTCVNCAEAAGTLHTANFLRALRPASNLGLSFRSAVTPRCIAVTESFMKGVFKMSTSQGLIKGVSPPRRRSFQKGAVRVSNCKKNHTIFTQNNKLELRFNADMKYLRIVRLITQEIAEGLLLNENSIYDLKLAVGEACANAIEHGSPLGCRNEIVVTFSWTENELRVEVADQGMGCWTETAQAKGTCERGFGIPLMEALMERVAFIFGSNGTKVILSKRI